MDAGIMNIFAETTLLQLSGMLGLALFFTLVGVREIRDERPEGYLYLTIAIFLTVAHAVILENLNSTTQALSSIGSWIWLVALLAPALIGMFLARALYNFAVYKGREGMVKLFFGLTLLCLVFMLGSEWPTDVRAILTIIWIGFLFKTELAIAN